MVLEMLFLTLNKANIRFVERELVWRTYSAVETLLMTMRVKIINKREFAVVVLNVDDKIFVVHVAALVKPTTMLIYPSYQTLITTLPSKETGIPTKYSDFCNIFSSDSAVELPEYTGINNHLINLLNNK